MNTLNLSCQTSSKFVQIGREIRIRPTASLDYEKCNKYEILLADTARKGNIISNITLNVNAVDEYAPRKGSTDRTVRFGTFTLSVALSKDQTVHGSLFKGLSVVPTLKLNFANLSKSTLQLAKFEFKTMTLGVFFLSRSNQSSFPLVPTVQFS